ncbi:cytochrome c [Luteitalea sp. TBR-22]|uniref:c-type cytochrome n=1 Tax=Luteitalea sp. TBR-22 TaxID=2802971 RepID=UPI001EF67AD4|nr:cytochrome c [Luteitalea sp. TBR-22]
MGILVALGVGVLTWAYLTASNYYEHTWTTHDATFAIPFPLSAADASTLAPGADPAVEALARAVGRGKHLVETRYSCNSCHGRDLGGSTVISSPFIGVWAAPNLTTGPGSVTQGFTALDWDRAVRHGIRHSGKTSSMPVTEFRAMSDHELSDIVAYIRSLPPVDRQMPPVRLGPLFSFLLATDRDATLVTYTIDHQASHAAEPPPLAASKELGQHIAQVCTGCHGPRFSGGAIAGDPGMPVVANLTMHETGLKGWTEADFLRAMQQGRRKDGTEIKPQMPWRQLGQMGETELKAVWAFLQTLPPVEKGNH